MDFTKVKMNLCRYRVERCDIESPDLVENYPVSNEVIGDIIIENDYFNFNLPFFQLSLGLPSSVLRAIKKHPLETYVHLSMTCEYYDNLDASNNGSPVSMFNWFNKKFIAFVEKQDRSLTDSAIEDIEDGLGYDTRTVDPQTMEKPTFTLYDENIVNSLGYTINDIISNGCLADILTYVLNKASITNVLLSPPNNFKSYKEFRLPPQDAYIHIDRICNDYGIHNNGTLIFFGLDRNYIIDINPKCTAYSVNEYQTTYLYYPGKGNESTTFSAGCCKNSAEHANYILFQPSAFRFANKSIEAHHAFSEDVVILSPLTGGTNKSNASYLVRRGGADTSKAIKRKIDSFSKTISLGLRNVDVDMLTPNKQFVLTIDDAKYYAYNGTYMLTKQYISLVKDGNRYSPLVVCEFRI